MDEPLGQERPRYLRPAFHEDAIHALSQTAQKFSQVHSAVLGGGAAGPVQASEAPAAAAGGAAHDRQEPPAFAGSSRQLPRWVGVGYDFPTEGGGHANLRASEPTYR